MRNLLHSLLPSLLLPLLLSCSKDGKSLIQTYVFPSEPGAATASLVDVKVQVDLLLNDNGVSVETLNNGSLFISAGMLLVNADGSRSLEGLKLQRNGNGVDQDAIELGDADLRTPLSLRFSTSPASLGMRLKRFFGLADGDQIVVYKLKSEVDGQSTDLLSAIAVVTPDVVSDEVTHLTVASTLASELLQESGVPTFESSDFAQYTAMVNVLSPMVQEAEGHLSTSVSHSPTDLITVTKTLLKSSLIDDLGKQQELSNVVANFPSSVQEQIHFATKLDGIVLEMRELSTAVEEKIQNSLSVESSAAVMTQVQSSKNQPIIFTASSLAFTDSDIVRDSFGGSLAIGRATDESDITSYVVYIGNEGDARADLQKIGEIEASGGHLTFALPSGTEPLVSLTSPALWVFTRNDVSELTIGLKVAFTDKTTADAVPSVKASSLSADNLTRASSGISGRLDIGRASDESEVSSYTIYWGSDSSTKLGGQPEIEDIGRNEATIEYTFPDNTPVPPGANTLLVYTSNDQGEGSNPVSVDLPAPALNPPASLSYANEDATYVKNQAITANTPASTGGTVSSYAINPSLPTGLNFDSSTGVINGTPTVASSRQAYVVTASNADGQTTQTIYLKVNEPLPQIAYSGSLLAHPNFAFSASPTNSGGPISSCSSLPALPTGLSLAATTCAISGTPTGTAALATYTITASGPGGDHQATVSLKVIKYCAGSGTLADPYQICDKASIVSITDLTSYFVQTADIDLAGHSSSGAVIGSQGNPFRGGYDGASFSISNYTYQNTGTNGVGLFHSITGASATSKAYVRNLTLKGFVIEGGGSVGALAGSTTDAELTGITLQASSTASSIEAGGVVGGLVGTAIRTSCRRCSVTASVTAVGATGKMGGIFGIGSNSSIVGSNVKGTISGLDYVGGMVGIVASSSSITISDSWMEGDLIGNQYVGGLVGSGIVTIENVRVRADIDVNQTTGFATGGLVGSFTGGTITSSEFHGDINARSMAGGIAGYITGTAQSISHCKTSGNYEVNFGSLGGIAGQNHKASITYSSSSANISLITNPPAGSGYIGGLVGHQVSTTATLSKVFATGTVDGKNNGLVVGGLIGELAGPLSQAYATGNVSGGGTVGGLVGRLESSISDSYASGTVTAVRTDVGYGSSAGGLVGSIVANRSVDRSYALGTASAATASFGGIIGYRDGVSVLTATDTYRLQTTGVNVGTAKTSAEMQNIGTFSNYDFATPVWTMVAGQAPQLFFPRTVNTYGSVVPTSIAAGSTSIELASASGFTAGDRILIIQMQDGSASAAAGTFEFATVASVASETLNLTAALSHSYKSGTFNTSSALATQVVKVHRSTNGTVFFGEEYFAPVWNGYSGGVLALEDSGTLTINGKLNAAGKGFRAGTSAALYACAFMPTSNGFAGESWNGIGEVGLAANGGAGGAGNSGVCGFGPNPWANWIGAAGGAGASHALAGEDRSAAAYNYDPQVLQGYVGSSYGVSNLSKILLGSGGGAGGAHDAGASSNGGAGGGIIIIDAQDLVLGANAIIDASASNGGNGTAPSGSGGGGSGGSILIRTTNSWTIGTGQVKALGGTGGAAPGGINAQSAQFRKGGDGSVGRIHLEPSTGSGTSSPAAQ